MLVYRLIEFKVGLDLKIFRIGPFYSIHRFDTVLHLKNIRHLPEVCWSILTEEMESTMKKGILASLVLLWGTTLTVFGGDMISKAPANAKVYFIEPKEGQTVMQNFKVKFGLSGMGVAPAGVMHNNTGHHHILINTDPSTVDMKKPIPATDKIKHFGGGQTETELTLPHGKHTLQLLVGNHLHIPHDKPIISKKITINVK